MLIIRFSQMNSDSHFNGLAIHGLGPTWFIYLLGLNDYNSTRKMSFGNYSYNRFNSRGLWSPHDLCPVIICSFPWDLPWAAWWKLQPSLSHSPCSSHLSLIFLHRTYQSLTYCIFIYFVYCPFFCYPQEHKSFEGKDILTFYWLLHNVFLKACLAHCRSLINEWIINNNNK